MILFNDLSSEYLSIKQGIDKAILSVLKKGWFILGEEAKHFEREFAQYLGVQYCVGVGSGTDAITLSLIALGVSPGDEVITTSLTAFPTITGIVNSGAVPQVVDILPDTGLLNPFEIERIINEKTKAIVPVHLYGQCCDMDSIMELSKSYKLKIIEDCAQACGAEFKGNKAGSIADCGAFSFYPTKNLGAYGDGGAIVTDDEKIYEKLKLLRNYGQSSRYEHDIHGLNSRLDEIQAAILRIKLKHIEDWNQKRTQIAEYYNSNLRSVERLRVNARRKHVYHLYVVKHSDRDKLMMHLEKKDIQTIIHYPTPVHKQVAFVFPSDGELTESETFCDQILSLPLHPFLKNHDIEEIVDCMNEF